MPWIDAAPRTAVSTGRMVEVEVSGTALLLYDLDGAIHATAAVCPHQAAWLSQGEIHGDWIDCPRHMGRFHIPTGRRLRGPACPNLRTYRVRVRVGRIEVEL